MFSIKAAPTFPAKVKIGQPGGKPQELPVVFRHKTQEEMTVFFQSATKDKRSDAEMIIEIVASWDADGELTLENVKELLSNHHSAAREIYDTYIGELGQARKGN